MKVISFLILLFFFDKVVAQPILLSEALTKEKNLEEEPALLIYNKLLSQNTSDVKLLCATSFLYSRVGNRKKNDVKKKYFLAAKINAEIAYKLQPTSAEVNYVLGLAYGRMAEIGTIKEKISYSKLIKKHADFAIKYNPNYAYGWHLLGKYNWELSKIGTLQMAAVNALYGGLPPGDLTTAISCFEKCKALDAGFLTNLVDLQKAYLANGQKEKAAFLQPTIKNAKPRFVAEIGMQ